MTNMVAEYYNLCATNMLYKAPDKLPVVFSRPSVFVAGGISNCPDWQTDITSIMDTNLYDVVNPRRQIGFDSTGAIAREQIEWEHSALSKIDSCIFWFPQETLCPITLLEAGRMIERAKHHTVRLTIGWHPNYARAFDLEVQIDLEKIPKEYMLYFSSGWDGFVSAVKKTYG